MKLLNDTTTFYSPEAARKAAMELKQGDPDWDYEVVDDPKGTGYSFIEIYDEYGEFVWRV